MGYKTSPCVFCVNDKLVFIASNPPCRHSCYEKSVLHVIRALLPSHCTITFHYHSPSFPSCAAAHFLSMYPASGPLFKMARVEQLSLLRVPLSFMLLEQAQGRSWTIPAPRAAKEGESSSSSCLPVSAAPHQL